LHPDDQNESKGFLSKSLMNRIINRLISHSYLDSWKRQPRDPSAPSSRLRMKKTVIVIYTP
jgi:hypothetical protein